MRFSATVLAGIVISACSVRAADDEGADARAIVSKSIEALGIKKEDKPVAMTWKDKGKFNGGGMEVPYTADAAFQGPDKYRFDISADLNGMKINFLVVVNGNKAWESGFGNTQEMSDEKLETVLNQVYQYNVMSLLPLLKDKEFKLAATGEKKVGDKEALVVVVKRDKRPTVTLYFDKNSKLLVKSEMTIKDEFQGWKEVPGESFFEDYKEVGGRKVFTKMRVVRDGKTLIESTLSDQKASEKLDAKLFEKP